MRLLLNSIILLLFLIISCDEQSKEDVIDVGFTTSIDPLVELVSSIEIIPLETDSVHIIGSQKDLIVSDDSYIISDASNGNIFRYSLDGRFQNKIGNAGRGPEEYTHFNNVQLVDSLLYVFSNPSKELVYSLNGEFISSTVYRNEYFGEMSYWTKEGIVTYYGYDSIHDHRLGLINDDKLTYYLPSREKVLHYSPLYPIYSSSKDTFFFIDSYSSTIKSFYDGKVSSPYSFNFRDYGIPDEFFNYSNSEEATLFLMKQEFAMISSFLSDEENHFMEIIVQKRPHPEAYYGYERQGCWHWFGAGRLGEDVFANSFKAMKEGKLYCLLDPLLLDSFPTELLAKVKEKDKPILGQIDKEDNYVLAIMNIKR